MSEISCFRLVTVKPEVDTKLIMMKEIKEEEDEEEDLVVTTSAEDAEDAEDHEAEAVPGTNKKVKVLKKKLQQQRRIMSCKKQRV